MEPANFRIRNWDKYQHYKDRNPPWIKLHVEILSSEDWVTLDDASKLLAVVCMIVGAKTGGLVPNKPDYLRRVGYLQSQPNLKPLVECRFLEPLADDSKLLASARPEKEADTEAERKNTSDKSDLFVPEPKPEKRKSPYPEPFEAFWREYPTDALMSKKAAFAQWSRLDQESREAARAAIPAFKAYCRKNPTYRPVHAQRFISDRRFDGFLAPAAASLTFEPADDRGWEERLRIWRERQSWLAKWGPDPSKDDCKCPPNILRGGKAA